LKVRLGKEFEVKDLGQLMIEVASAAEGIVLSHRKYVLDLLTEIGVLSCRLAASSIYVKAKISVDAGKHIDHERYQRLVDRLIYLCHIRPDILFAVSVVSRYMHDPRKGHMDTVYHILRYLKSASGNSFIFIKN
jgi:hypothetical protein